MAHLRPLTTTSSSSDAAPEEGLPHPLRSVHLIGRTAPSNLCLQDPKVSSAHARLRWTGAGWELRDLGSTNGTFVDGSAHLPVVTRILQGNHADGGDLDGDGDVDLVVAGGAPYVDTGRPGAPLLFEQR
jgi:pSer/pThr/pTyr-binding forkhead associated (FHA) protein